MRSMAGLMLALGLLTVGPAAAQSDLSALRGKARMPITMTIEGGSLGDALSMLAEAADIEIRVEPDWAASPPLTAKFINAHFGDALTFLLNQRQLKATVLDSRTVVVSTISGQDPPPAVAAAKPAVVRLRVEIYRNQQPLARPMLANSRGYDRLGLDTEGGQHHGHADGEREPAVFAGIRNYVWGDDGKAATGPQRRRAWRHFMDLRIGLLRAASDPHALVGDDTLSGASPFQRFRTPTHSAC